MVCNIIEKGFWRVFNFVKFGVWEFEIEVEYIYEFLCNCFKGFVYMFIIVSGNNVNVFYYIENN